MLFATRKNRAVESRRDTVSAPRRTIGLLLYDLRASGVVRNAIRIAEAARRAGLDARLWPIRHQGELSDHVPKGVPVEPILPGRSRRQRDLDSLRALPTLRRAIRERRPAILFSAGNQVHIHAALALPRAGSPGRPAFIGRASNAVASAGRELLRKMLRPFEHFQYAAMDRIVAVSEELGADLERAFALAPGTITIVPNGVDLESIELMAQQPARHAFFTRDGPPVVLAAGRYSRQKNFECLIRAFALARSRVPLRLLIVGPGDEWRREKLRRLARALVVAESVSIEGFAPNPFALIRRAQLFVLSSSWEGASNVLLEALACGCPVVATRVPTGIVEVMKDGALGPLVAPDDPEAMAEAMLARISEPRNAEELIDRARDYDLRRTLDAYVELLSSEFAIADGSADPC
jgi:glycosyltransferase involved in cell wall biosynthesis